MDKKEIEFEIAKAQEKIAELTKQAEADRTAYRQSAEYLEARKREVANEKESRQLVEQKEALENEGIKKIISEGSFAYYTKGSYSGRMETNILPRVFDAMNKSGLMKSKLTGKQVEKVAENLILKARSIAKKKNAVKIEELNNRIQVLRDDDRKNDAILSAKTEYEKLLIGKIQSLTNKIEDLEKEKSSLRSEKRNVVRDLVDDEDTLLKIQKKLGIVEK